MVTIHLGSKQHHRENVQWLILHVHNWARIFLLIGKPPQQIEGILILFHISSHLLMHSCRWLYHLFLGIDANFQLKCKDISNEKSDPSLSKGWSYFVKETNFKKHLSEHINQPVDVSPVYLLSGHV